ncbi:Gamma interferon inducible lysosomal thiol reductase GILT [Lasallia pustulata]|uniref:Gamma interferon inducible lysosomal thiol reductase GILT n=1 Tax=Lasallia pustulata TaxID=136370 RepID=A0A1W5CWG8_9LECA|nr:Gamma interferon inducible lysosomal thiol reductase GILT [Lasallia pustulata]
MLVPRTLSRRRFLSAVGLTCLFVLIFSSFCGYPSSLLGHQKPHKEDHEPSSPQSTSNKTTRIPLEAHLMSKCPDARSCLRELVVPAMEKIADKVDFKLSYIGSIDANSDSVSCMHGPTECLGNMLSLCAQTLYANYTKISLGFTTCMVSSYHDIPKRDLVESCALEHGVDFDKLNGCVSDEGTGMDLLRDSIERSKEAGVIYSCTVRLDGKVRCIRDGGEWKDCEGGSSVGDLVRDVEEAYAKRAGNN